MKIKKLTACLLAVALSFSAFAPAAYATETTTAAPVTQGIVPEEAASFTPDAESFTSHTITLPAGEKTAVHEITMKHGGYLYIPLTISGTEKSITVQLYSDAACTAKVGYSQYLSSSTLSATLKTPIPKAGTYYLQLSVYSGMASNTDVTINPYCYNGDNREIANKKEVYSFSGNNDIIYHKISVSKNGYITVDADSNNSVGSVNVQLFNSSKKELSGSVYLSASVNGNKTAFAVKKGTYYIGTKSSDIVHLKYAFTAVSEKSGSSKSKAVSIGTGKTVKGLVLPTDSASKCDYYKVKLSKKQTLSLTISTKACDQLRFKIIPANSKTIIFGDTIRMNGTDKQSVKSKEKFAAGTYYIEVSKSAKTTSGYYTIKFNK